MRVLVSILALGICHRASGLDPFTASASCLTGDIPHCLTRGFSRAGTAVMGVMDGLDKMEEMANLGFSLNDLLSDLGANTDAEEAEINWALRRLESVRSHVNDLGSTTSDIERLLNTDLASARSLSDQIRYLRSTIEMSKRIATIAGLRPKAAEKAVRIQEIRINSMILEELQSIRRAQYLKDLEEREIRTKQNLLAHEIRLQEERKRR